MFVGNDEEQKDSKKKMGKRGVGVWKVEARGGKGDERRDEERCVCGKPIGSSNEVTKMGGSGREGGVAKLRKGRECGKREAWERGGEGAMGRGKAAGRKRRITWGGEWGKGKEEGAGRKKKRLGEQKAKVAFFCPLRRFSTSYYPPPLCRCHFSRHDPSSSLLPPPHPCLLALLGTSSSAACSSFHRLLFALLPTCSPPPHNNSQQHPHPSPARSPPIAFFTLFFFSFFCKKSYPEADQSPDVSISNSFTTAPPLPLRLPLLSRAGGSGSAGLTMYASLRRPGGGGRMMPERLPQKLDFWLAAVGDGSTSSSVAGSLKVSACVGE
eukprot:Rhum_TRINITY_DN14379_c3_g1::Rhum_TRINITY_DN14379_c3_g1_i1::g.86308::m.86308